MTIKRKILLFVACCLLASCAKSPEVEEQVEQAVDVLYQDALKTAIDGEPKEAAPKFEEVERQHPYSRLATRAQVMAAWSFYEANQYSRATAALDRFIELNPADPLVEYAYYLKALQVRRLIAQDFENAYQNCDLLLTPTTPSAAFGLDKGENDPLEMYLNDVFTVTVNLAGLPGISVPAGLDAKGLPLGLQLIGKAFGEEELLRAAQVLETAAAFSAAPADWWTKS